MLVKLGAFEKIIFNIVCCLGMISCNNKSSSSSPPPPPPPPPPPSFVSTLNLSIPLPAQFIIEGELPPNSSTSYPITPPTTSFEQMLKPGLTNIVEMHKEQRSQNSSSAAEILDLSYEVKVEDIKDEELSISKRVLNSNYQSSYFNGPFLDLNPVTFKCEREDLRGVLSTRNFRFQRMNSTMTIPSFNTSNMNSMNSTGGMSFQYQLQYCTPSMSNGSDFQIHYYRGHYHSSLGGPDVPVFFIRKVQTVSLSCNQQTMNWSYNPQPQQPGLPANPGVPASPPLNPYQPPAPNPVVTTQVRLISEEQAIYVSQAAFLTNFADEYDIATSILQFQSKMTKIEGGPILMGESIYVHAPTFN